MNNLVELFSLSSDEFSGSLDEVLAARLDKPPVQRYNLRSGGGINKSSSSKDASGSAEAQQ